MPTYQYQCKECGVSFERFQRFSEEPLRTCPECSGAVFRVIQPVGIIFKGSGFYVTDHRGGASPATAPLMDKKAGETGQENKPAPSTGEGEKSGAAEKASGTAGKADKSEKTPAAEKS